MAISLDGKTAIVTGASSGFGAAIAKSLQEAGVKVAVGARRVDRLDGDFAAQLDVTDPESAERFVAAAVEALGGLDILVNNAGGAIGRYPFTESSEEDEEWMIETNVSGLIRMTRLCLPHIRDGGHIVNMDSIAGKQAYENAAVYCAVKAAVSMFSAALREDLLGRPIRITDLAPGLAGGTEFSLVRFKGDKEKAAAVYKGVEPLTADDIADCVLFALTRPLHVNIDEIVVKALAQSSGGRILRDQLMALTILEGSTFCICDELGDITEKTGGFFAADTRYLSLFRLTVNGATPLLLSSGKVEHFSAAFYLRNPLAEGLAQDSVAIVRERFVSDAMQERITVENVTGQPVSFELASRWRTTSPTSSRSRSTTSRSATRRAPNRSPRPPTPDWKATGLSSTIEKKAVRAPRSPSRSSARWTAARSATGSTWRRGGAGN